MYVCAYVCVYVYRHTHACMKQTTKEAINLSLEEYGIGLGEGRWEGLEGVKKVR